MPLLQRKNFLAVSHGRNIDCGDIFANFQFSIFNFQFYPRLFFDCYFRLRFKALHYSRQSHLSGYRSSVGVLKVAPLTFNVEHAVEYALSALGAAAFFLAIVLISRGKWMGVGDIKLAFLMGLILGWPNISVALFLAFLIGAIIGVGLMIFGKKTMKSEVPFGPFLVGGTFIALFFGKEIINWYVSSIFNFQF